VVDPRVAEAAARRRSHQDAAPGLRDVQVAHEGPFGPSIVSVPGDDGRIEARDVQALDDIGGRSFQEAWTASARRMMLPRASLTLWGGRGRLLRLRERDQLLSDWRRSSLKSGSPVRKCPR
jgi:hypothetical protein